MLNLNNVCVVVPLPCLRCGNEPSLRKTKHSYYVKCRCEMEGKHFRRGNGTPHSKKLMAIMWWNKR